MTLSPLSAGERAAADKVARRLCLELRSLLEIVPEADLGASALSRLLKVDRNTCQRIVASTSRGEPDAGTLVQLPGTAGLGQFADAMAKQFKSDETDAAVAGVRAAIDRFQSLTDELGGSQRKLKERLDLSREAASDESLRGGDNVAARRALFRSAVDIVGRWSEVRLTTRIIRAVPSDPTHTENIRMTGHIGHVSRPGAVPLEVYSSVPEGQAEDEGPAFRSMDLSQSAGDTPRFLMTEYCSEPLPRVTSRVAGGRVVHAIDETATVGLPSDIFVADRRTGRDKHPATLHPAIGEVSTIMNFPAKRLVKDVFLHRDIASRCIPSLEVHLSSLQPGQMVLSRWSTRIPGGPRLELLGMGLEHAQIDAYPRADHVIRDMFTSMDWDPAEFVGYRCDVLFPIWRAAYCMLFDFRGNEIPQNAAD